VAGALEAGVSAETGRRSYEAGCIPCNVLQGFDENDCRYARGGSSGHSPEARSGRCGCSEERKITFKISRPATSWSIRSGYWQSQVCETTAFETIRKNQDMAEIASHFNLSFEQTVRLTRFRIYLAIRAGQLYAALPDETYHGGRNGVNQVDVITTKQSAVETLGKSRETISQWVKMAYVENPYDRADEYCERYKEDEDHRKAVDEPTLKGYYHWLFGIIASHHTGNQENFTPTDIEEYISPLIERFTALTRFRFGLLSGSNLIK